MLYSADLRVILHQKSTTESSFLFCKCLTYSYNMTTEMGEMSRRIGTTVLGPGGARSAACKPSCPPPRPGTWDRNLTASLADALHWGGAGEGQR